MKPLADCQIVVCISNRFLWEITPFFHYFNKFWGDFQPVTVVGAKAPPERPNLNFVRVPDPLLIDGDWHFGKFSDGVEWHLQNMVENYVILMCADFWLCRKANVRLVGLALEYMAQHPEVLRFNLADDNAYWYAHEFRDCFQGVEIFGCPGDRPHCFLETSLDTAAWNRKLLLQIVQKGWSPWDFEKQGQRVLQESHADPRSVTTKRGLVKHVHLMREGATQMDLRTVPPGHREDYAHWAPPGCQVFR